MQAKPYQRGSALIISLVFLLLLTMIGITSIQDSTLQERMAGNERDRNLAFQAAEASLREGEAYLREESQIFTASGTGGLLSPDYTGSKPTEPAYPWAARSRASSSLTGLSTAPRYAVEWLITEACQPDEIVCVGANSYRITARAVGGSTDAVVLLQATYSR